MSRAPSAERRARSVVIALILLAAPSSLAAQPACVPVAARQLARGTVLSLDDIAVKIGSALCAQRSALVGSQTRRVVNAGEPLREPAVAAPNVIAYGQPVAVVYRDGGIELRLTGTAVNAAPVGGRVAVRIEPSLRSGQAGRRLEGVATGPGLVQLK